MYKLLPVSNSPFRDWWRDLLHYFYSSINKDETQYHHRDIDSSYCTAGPAKLFRNRAQTTEPWCPMHFITSMAFTAYDSVVKTSATLSQNDNRADGNKGGQPIQQAVWNHAAEQYEQGLKGFKWEYNTISDNTINAWCMPVVKWWCIPACRPFHKRKKDWPWWWDMKLPTPLQDTAMKRMNQDWWYSWADWCWKNIERKSSRHNYCFRIVYGQSILPMPCPTAGCGKWADKLGLIFARMAEFITQEAAVPFISSAWRQTTKPNCRNFCQHISDETRIKTIRDHPWDQKQIL